MIVALATKDGRVELQCIVITLTAEQRGDIERAAKALGLIVRYDNG